MLTLHFFMEVSFQPGKLPSQMGTFPCSWLLHLCVDFLIKLVNVPQLPGLLQANMAQIQPLNIPKHIAVHVQNKCR